MLEEKIKRINELAKKSRTSEGLSDDEKIEQAKLRQEYRDEFKKNMTSQLDNIRIVESDGTKTKITPNK